MKEISGLSVILFLALANLRGEEPTGPRVAQSAAEAPTQMAALAPGTSVAASLEDSFRDPPTSARPWVWWHWMNGNVTTDGLAKDLAWMKRIGIGGLHNFDAAFSTPQIVDQRLAYLSPGWKEAFRFALRRADELGLGYGIAASPGWTETGGPWVKPDDAMKKLVWSETMLAGGEGGSHQLPPPPAVTGPYQAILKPELLGQAAPLAVGFYRDVAVLAFPVPAPSAMRQPEAVTSNGLTVNAAVLWDGDLATGVDLPARSPDGPGKIEFIYLQPELVSAAVVFVANLPRHPIAGPLIGRLEAGDDGREWRTITEIPLTSVPTTVSFEPVTASRFRLVFVRGKGPDRSSFAMAPGVDIGAAMGVGGPPKAPQKLVDFRLLPTARVHAFEQKAGFAIADDYYALDGSVGADVKGVQLNTVIDLTEKMLSDGRLDWTPPAGHWKVLRLGYSLTGALNSPASPEATGLEVDKYDAAAVRQYLTTYLGMYREAAGDGMFGLRGLRVLLTDSTEVGPSNWTPQLLAQFQRLRGYDARPWLPVLTGEIVGSRRQSDAFLYDFRRTLGELAATEHYGTIARIAHEQDLTVYGESLEGGRSTLGDDIEMRRFADVPMGALWAFAKGKPAPEYVADLRGAASVAHVYGRKVVASESLTSILCPWAFAPVDLQPMVDTLFLNGVNRPVLHSVVHQPVDDKQPGLSLQMFGQYFSRHETWAEMAGPWINYIARNSYLLQQGRNVADVAYFYGEEAPVGVLALNRQLTGMPARYAYDFISPDIVLNELSVDGADVVSKGGARYRVIYLGGLSQLMTLPVLRRLQALVEEGATLVGEAPRSSPSLRDDATEFTMLVARLWGPGKVTAVGKGRVVAGRNVEEALATVGVAPDFRFTAASPDAKVSFLHRKMEDGDLYFVSNGRVRSEQIEARFRVAGRAPEIWRTDTGAVEPVSYRIEGGETAVQLELRAEESFFVVFRGPPAAPAQSVEKHVFTQVGEISGSWDVAFQPARGAPASKQLAELGPLSEQEEPGIKYFSGVATYTKKFNLPEGTEPGQRLLLDLGRIGDVAEVRVNGKIAGIAWKPPYRVEIGALVQAGENDLEVRVANLWVNRLIGDQQPGVQKIAFTTVKTYTAKAPLRPSGLIGPVRFFTTH